jgi:outer membrane protein assembly factor BamB
MQIMRNKTATFAIVILLTLSMLSSTMLLQNVSAHAPAWTIPTWAYISVMPNPVGVGQTTFLGFWIDKVPPTAYQEYGDRWHNFMVTVTKPDGTTETLGPFTSDDAGGAHTTYAPTQLGNYTFVFNFPGETLKGDNPSPIAGTAYPAYVGDYFSPSTSPKATLTVQQEPVVATPTAPLPTGYWQRPIPSMNLDWYKIAGNWLGYAAGSGGGAAGGAYYNKTDSTANFNPYTTAPNTGHIVWTKPYSFGGIMGGDYGGTQYGSAYNSDNQYQPKWGGIIINGVVYYSLIPGSTTNPAGWVAVDLRTGQTLWTKNTTSVLRTGQILNIINPNQYGGFPYLWALPPSPYAGTTSGGLQLNNTWEMYDAMTGNYILSIVNAPTAPAVIRPGLTVQIALLPTMVSDDNGNLIGYYVNGTTRTLNMWNSTLAIIKYNYQTGRSVNTWTWNPPQVANIDWSLGIQWTKPLATTVTAPNGTSVNISPTLNVGKIASNVLVLTSSPEAFSQFMGEYTVQAGYSAVDGSLLWGPIWRTITPYTRMNALAAAADGIFYEFTMETMSWRAFSLNTGQLVWGPISLGNSQDVYGYYTQQYIVAYGALYMTDLGGYVYALNATTGARLWTFFTGDAGLDTPYGVYPLYNLAAAADGKIFALGGHLYSPPLYPGSKIYALNATTGELIWDMPSFVITNQPNCALAEGYFLLPNAYDNQLYCYGKGTSKLTVTAPSVGVTTTTPITISGTITDTSPGSQQSIALANFPNGLPCVSDDTMTGWMEYVYMQQPCPANVKGVPVSIDVLDSNGNYRNIGTATSDGSGTFAFTWTPDIPGDFTVVATFAGSESYWPSNSEAHFHAASAPTAVPVSTAAPSIADQYFVPSVVAIIVVIIIGFAVLAMLMLRKRP